MSKPWCWTKFMPPALHVVVVAPGVAEMRVLCNNSQMRGETGRYTAVVEGCRHSADEVLYPKRAAVLWLTHPQICAGEPAEHSFNPQDWEELILNSPRWSHRRW